MQISSIAFCQLTMHSNVSGVLDKDVASWDLYCDSIQSFTGKDIRDAAIQGDEWL